MQFIFQLGRLPTLSLYELHQLLPGVHTEQLNEQYLLLNFSDKESLVNVLEKSGGVIKALEILEEKHEKLDFSDQIELTLKTTKMKDFGVFMVPHQSSDQIQLEIKKNLKKENFSVRYVRSSIPGGLSASVLTHHNTAEFGIFDINNRHFLAQTFWVQNIDHWSMKDRVKPHRNPDKGMMPPKLARMMINFVSQEIQSQVERKLYDPFCGTGTMLIEGAELGWQIVGSDLSQEAIFQSGENLHWFGQKINQELNPTLFMADATQVSLQQLQKPVDAIVTEPFLGKQQPKPDQLPGMFKGLEKQYLGILKRWTQILKPGGEVVIITPQVQIGKKTFTLEKIIDKSREFGYSILSGPMIYSREHTIVQRAIYHLKFHK